MCGMEVEDDERGGGEEVEDEFGVCEGVRMLPPPVVRCDGRVWGSRRGGGECVCWGMCLVLWNLLLTAVCMVLMATVFTLILLPAVLLLYVGFLCHSRVLASPSAICRYLDDNSCSALIILGFVMMSPLVVVAAATFCSLLRWLRLLLYFQPISGARYRGQGFVWRRDFHAWV
ncbi:transmembrane protein 88 isoform X2 [Hoplias malabaricus]